MAGANLCEILVLRQKYGLVLQGTFFRLEKASVYQQHSLQHLMLREGKKKGGKTRLSV